MHNKYLKLAGAACLLILPLFFVDLETLSGGHPPPAELSVIAHISFFGTLTWVLVRARHAESNIGYILAVVAGLLAFSAAIEIGQHFTGREASIRDIWWNAAGIALGLIFALHKRELVVSLLAVPALALVASSLLMTFLTAL